MDMMSEFKRLQATETMIETWFSIKGQWVAIFEKLKAMDTPYVEALCFGEMYTGMMESAPLGDAVGYWCAEVYERLEDYAGDGCI